MEDIALGSRLVRVVAAAVLDPFVVVIFSDQSIQLLEARFRRERLC